MSKLKKTVHKGESKPARIERRVRVIFFLVADKKEHFNAIDSIRDYLRIQYLIDERWRPLPVTGFTHSLFPGPPPFPSGEPVFVGYWWSKNRGINSLTVERTVLFLIDFPAYAEEWKTDENINLLKSKIFEYYEANRSPQEEIWIVKQDIYRYA